MNNQFPTIDSSWTLFVDRDGVLNYEKAEGYIYNLSEFKLYDGVLNTLGKLKPLFTKLLLVTNQKGIGKGLMTEADLTEMHQYLQAELAKVNGQFDQIYFCPDIDNDSYYRKPNPGMAYQAQLEFPEIDLSKSIIIGNKLSDMRFGKAAGMKTIYVKTTHPDVELPEDLVDAVLPDFNALPDFLKSLS